MSRRWSYKVVEVKGNWTGMKAGDAEEALVPLGLQGWELVAVVPFGTSVRLYLKREQ